MVIANAAFSLETVRRLDARNADVEPVSNRDCRGRDRFVRSLSERTRGAPFSPVEAQIVPLEQYDAYFTRRLSWVGYGTAPREEM